MDAAALAIWRSLRSGPTSHVILEIEYGGIETGYVVALRGNIGEVLLARCVEELTLDDRYKDRWTDPRYRIIRVEKITHASVFTKPFEVVKREEPKKK